MPMRHKIAQAVVCATVSSLTPAPKSHIAQRTMEKIAKIPNNIVHIIPNILLISFIKLSFLAGMIDYPLGAGCKKIFIVSYVKASCAEMKINDAYASFLKYKKEPEGS